MIDFHSHTFLSDGVLSPAEHVRRALIAGYKVLGITDHVDFSNIEDVYRSIRKLTDEITGCGWNIKVIPGIEITHVPVSKIAKLVDMAHTMGIPLVIMHGESPVEPVEKGTNRAAIEAGVDILAHPGLITDEDVMRSVEKNVSLEITSRKGHSLANGHVAKLAEKYKANLVLDSDAHAPDDFLKENLRQTVLKGCGMNDNEIDRLEKNINNAAEIFLKRM
jgi:putative hydrolase